MASRFSQLFAGPTTIEARAEAMLNEPSTPSPKLAKIKSKRRPLSTLLLDLLRSRTPKSTPLQTGTAPTKKASKSRLSLLSKRKSTIAAPVTVSPFSQHLHRSTISISSLPLPGQKPRSTSISNSIISSNNKAPSIHDSKFSSVSSKSSLSFHTASSHHLSQPYASTHALTLSPQKHVQLLSLTRRLNRALRRQEILTQGFSGNVAFLMGRKERNVELNRRLEAGVRRDMLGLMCGLRGLVGRCFLRKAVFLQRSCEVGKGIGEAICCVGSSSDDGAESGEEVCGEDEGRVVSGETVEVRLDIEAVLAAIGTMKDDLVIQRGLDLALRDGIAGPCEDRRLPASENERISMRRFVIFIDAQVGVLDGVYRHLGDVMERLRLLLGSLKTD